MTTGTMYADVEVSKIIENVSLPRSDKDTKDYERSIVELAQSIQSVGVLEPIGLRISESDKKQYVVVYGNRRLAAAKKAGLKTIPALFVSGPISEDRDLTLIENIQRRDIPEMDKALAVHALVGTVEKKDRRKKIQAVAATIGKTERTIYGWLQAAEEVIKERDQEKAVEIKSEKTGKKTVHAAKKKAQASSKKNISPEVEIRRHIKSLISISSDFEDRLKKILVLNSYATDRTFELHMEKLQNVILKFLSNIQK